MCVTQSAFTKITKSLFRPKREKEELSGEMQVNGKEK